jgi:hypothetical protein
MVAPRTLKSDELHLGHDSMSYITNRDIPQLFDGQVLPPYLLDIYLISIYGRVRP